jgi:outer membrane protein assembly factor BamB
VGDVDVYAFDRSTGARAWSFRASDDDETGTHALGTDGTTIYASSYLGRVYALDGHTGAPAWVTQLPGPPGVRVLTFDPVAAGGKIFVGLWYDTAPVTGGLAALDASTGQLLWTHEFTPIRPELESFCGGGAVAVDGVVVASSADGQIYGLDVATGAQRWVSPQIPNYDLDDLRALALSNGLVIASSSSGRATALDPATGAIRWLKVVSGASLAYQVSADDQLAVFGTNEVLAVDPLSGNVLWHTGDTQQSKKFFGYAAVGPDEVFANGVDGFYALRKR